MKPDLITIDLKELAELLQNEVIDYCNICEHQNKYVECKKPCTRGIARYLRKELTNFNTNTEVKTHGSDKN